MSFLSAVRPARSRSLAGGTSLIIVGIALLISRPASVGAAPQAAPSHGSRLSRVDWRQAAGGDLDCHIPGLGLESPIVRYHDITRDGVPDSFVVLRCRTGDSSAFDQLEVFDGASDPANPRRIGVLVRAPRSQDYMTAIRTGMKIKSVTFAGPLVTITGRMVRSQNGSICLGIAAKRTATWNGHIFDLGPLITIRLNPCNQ